ncbi:type II toxin-antitoxin system VapB family antitoxin [Phyllobacterium meliloti]|uniref:type II toxin-antitoxin system VapB family antitoxin n=1 Tax=Phyllobacterium meliloti TaxID=555317 RepID=UPI001D14A60B|nr:type II toxin-antitoxin system VapB family antitoxin [Phyllobacterium sp. T1293]UGX88847.1 type II toxin-antitoxin system VapB family antitoxin [Phyllobacterium sp. T1293]
MAFSVKDETTDAAVRRLAKLKNTSLTDAIREAVVNEYNRTKGEIPLQERLAALSQRYKAYPKTGQDADKTFFDDLSGDL